MESLSCREKIVKFLLGHKNGDDRGIIGYHLAQGIGEKYPTVMQNVKKLVSDGVVVEVPFDCEKDKKIKCKYQLQPFYYDEKLYLDFYNFMIPYLSEMQDTSLSPFDAKAVLRVIFNEVLENHG